MRVLRLKCDDGYTREYLIPHKARVKVSTHVPVPKVTVYREDSVGNPDNSTVNTRSYSDLDNFRGTWSITRPQTVMGIDLEPVRIWKTGSSQTEPW